MWRSQGKPKQGFTLLEMKKSRSYFKFVLRKCKQDVSKLTADSLANKLLCKNDNVFWKEVKKMNQCNVPVVSTIDGVTGVNNINNMWQQHYKSLLNSSKDTSSKEYVVKHVSEVDNGCFYFERFTVDDVKESFKNIKNGKTCGLDGIYGEHLKHAHSKIHVLLSLLFNVITIHGHMPLNLMDTLIVPMVKDKKGNLTDKDNYRPLAITCIVSKVFEVLILTRYHDTFKTSDNQFGFKDKMSTELCIYTLKQVTEYYVQHDSAMYICFLDASKAFDKINHWLLFRKLIDRHVPSIIVRILMVWYVRQNFYVRWSNSTSSSFTVTNGVRQGGILSPYLFNLYIDDLSVKLNNVSTGCIFNGGRINHLFYADDAVLLAPSPHAMQQLLNVCDDFACEQELIYNVKKTFCVCVRPKWLKNITIPNMFLSGNIVNITSNHKYLGMYIMDSLNDEMDMKRQLRSIYARGNVLIKQFRQCSEDVKIKLFKAYCSSFYCLALWNRFTVANYKKVKSSYNRIFRNFLQVDRDSMSLTMVLNNVKSFQEIERNLIYGLKCRLLMSDNQLVCVLVDSLFFNSSKLTTGCFNKNVPIQILGITQ